jgi:hypothetical protein
MSGPTQGGVLKSIIFFVLVPLFVFIVGGLAVEYLKPKQEFRGSDVQSAAAPAGTGKDSERVSTTSTAPAAPPGPGPRAAAMKEMLVKKWHVKKDPTGWGDMEVEFTDYGKAVRTYKRMVVSDAVESFSYEITPEGELVSKDLPNLRLVKLTKDELTLNWGKNQFGNEEIAEYKRPWYWWEIALIVGGIVLFVIICIAIKAAADKS